MRADGDEKNGEQLLLCVTWGWAQRVTVFSEKTRLMEQSGNSGKSPMGARSRQW